MNIVNLPEEVLVLILEYLSTRDKLNLQTACETFHQILKNNKKLIRKLNFARCYTADISSIKYFLKPEICKSVKELDLTSCYWLKSVDVRRCVLKLSNLEALYLADTSLSISDLIKILKALHQLKRLSFSLKPVSVCDSGSLCLEIKSITLELQRLEFLLVYVKTVSFSRCDMIALYNWLAHCIGLKELWVIVPKQSTCVVSDSTTGTGALHFPYLHTLVISSFFKVSYFLRHIFSVILEGCMSVTSWDCFWVSIPDAAFHFKWPSSSSSGIFEAARTLLESWIDRRCVPDVCPQLEHLSLSTKHLRILESTVKKLILTSSQPEVTWDFLCNSDANLEELNLVECVSNIQNIPPQKNLHKLALPTCSIRGEGGSDSTIQVVVEKFPNTEEFELMQCACGILWTYASQPHVLELESSFMLFAKWKNLRRLKFECVELIGPGKFFIQIFKSCEKLESISLKHLGLMGNCNYLFELSRALQFCKNLRDFRIEQPNMCSIDRLLTALQLCPVIERVCVISNGGKLSLESVLVDFVCGSSKLVFLYVQLGTLSRAACKRMQSCISASCKNRPALNVTLLPNIPSPSEDRDVAKLPGIHYFEMREDVSRIGTKFGNWYLACM